MNVGFSEFFQNLDGVIEVSRSVFKWDSSAAKPTVKTSVRLNDNYNNS